MTWHCSHTLAGTLRGRVRGYDSRHYGPGPMEVLSLRRRFGWIGGAARYWMRDANRHSSMMDGYRSWGIGNRNLTTVRARILVGDDPRSFGRDAARNSMEDDLSWVLIGS